MADTLVDILTELQWHNVKTDKRLEQLLLHYQLEQAAKTPVTTKFFTVLLLVPTTGMAPTPMQFLPANPRRSQIGIVNNGGDDLLISTSQFDPTSILQQISDPINPVTGISPNQVVSIGLVRSGAAVSYAGTSALYGYNVGAATGVVGALLSFVEEIFLNTNPRGIDGAPGISGLQALGYEANGHKSLR